MADDSLPSARAQRMPAATPAPSADLDAYDALGLVRDLCDTLISGGIGERLLGEQARGTFAIAMQLTGSADPYVQRAGYLQLLKLFLSQPLALLAAIGVLLRQLQRARFQPPAPAAPAPRPGINPAATLPRA